MGVLINALLVILAVIAVFLISFVIVGDPTKAAIWGLIVGLLSAAAWGIGSIGGPEALSNGANIFAALFAAMTLGFLAPTQACPAPYWLANQVCRLRAYVHALESR